MTEDHRRMTDPVLVTGAGGFAGSHLVEHLAGFGPVVGWGRSAAPREIAAIARWERIDLLDRAAVRAAIARLRPREIYHCAGVAHVAESWQQTAATLAGNALATHHLLDALARSGAGARVLIAGTSYVYAPGPEPIGEDAPAVPAGPYALSKFAQEQLALDAGRHDGIEVVVARAFNHTGPRQQPSFIAPAVARQIALIERGTQPPVLKVGNLEATRDLSDVRDVVRGYRAIMGAAAPGAVYNVASGTGRTIRSVVDALVARARVPIAVDVDAARFRPNDIPVLVGNASRLRQLTGWSPEIPFDRTLDDLLEYWRQHA
jgi:GDP-4-dehydro-6-deoxy-D-mannose reductase